MGREVPLSCSETSQKIPRHVPLPSRITWKVHSWIATTSSRRIHECIRIESFAAGASLTGTKVSQSLHNGRAVGAVEINRLTRNQVGPNVGNETCVECREVVCTNVHWWRRASQNQTLHGPTT